MIDSSPTDGVHNFWCPSLVVTAGYTWKVERNWNSGPHSTSCRLPWEKVLLITSKCTGEKMHGKSCRLPSQLVFFFSPHLAQWPSGVELSLLVLKFAYSSIVLRPSWFSYNPLSSCYGWRSSLCLSSHSAYWAHLWSALQLSHLRILSWLKSWHNANKRKRTHIWSAQPDPHKYMGRSRVRCFWHAKKGSGQGWPPRTTGPSTEFQSFVWSLISSVQYRSGWPATVISWKNFLKMDWLRVGI